jgi:hypothetical protein
VGEKIKIVRLEKGVEIVGNREGLLGLADICARLARLPEDDAEARRLGNHYHYAEYMNNAEEGSIELMIRYKPDL